MYSNDIKNKLDNTTVNINNKLVTTNNYMQIEEKLKSNFY